MGLSRITALEIFSQPDDLCFKISQNGSKWQFVVCRGPGHNYKILLSTTPFAENRERAIREIEIILQQICTSMSREVSNPNGLTAAFTNPTNEPLDNANALSREYRERIIADLRARGEAHTYTYKK